MNDKCKLMTKKDLSRYIGKSIRTVERWVSNGSLPPANKSFGRSGFWLESEVDSWLNDDYRKELRKLAKRGAV